MSPVQKVFVRRIKLIEDDGWQEVTKGSHRRFKTRDTGVDRSRESSY